MQLKHYEVIVSIYLFKVDNGSARITWEIFSKLTIKRPERRQWHCSGVFIVNTEQISHIVLVFSLWFWTNKSWLSRKCKISTHTKNLNIHFVFVAGLLYLIALIVYSTSAFSRTVQPSNSFVLACITMILHLVASILNFYTFTKTTKLNKKQIVENGIMP